MALTALAGPVSNVLITVVFLLLYGALFAPLRGSAVGEYMLDMLYLTAYISMGYAVFNMLPVPPLDGSKVLFSVMDEGSYRSLMRYERYGGLVLMALVWSGVLGKPLSAAIRWCFGLLAPLAQHSYELVNRLFY
jgi:Zn-dependent protease